MILEVEGVPWKLPLPLDEAVEEPLGLELPGQPLDQEAVRVHVLEGEHHIEFPVVGVRQLPGLLRGHQHRLPHGETIVFRQHLPAEPLEELMAAGTGDIVFAAYQGSLGEAVLQAVLPKEVDDVAPEARHAAAQPEVHDLLHGVDDGGVSIVEVRLAFGEQVQIPLPPYLVEGPGPAAEEAGPVVGGALAVPIPPDVEFLVGRFPAAALLEPFVLVGGVVDDQVHDDLQPQGVGFLNKLVHVGEGAELRVDVAVVGDVVAVVLTGGAVDRGEPKDAHPQRSDIGEFGDDAGDVAHAVAVAVAIAHGIDLIDRLFLPPRLHRRLLVMRVS